MSIQIRPYNAIHADKNLKETLLLCNKKKLDIGAGHFANKKRCKLIIGKKAKILAIRQTINRHNVELTGKVNQITQV